MVRKKFLAVLMAAAMVGSACPVYAAGAEDVTEWIQEAVEGAKALEMDLAIDAPFSIEAEGVSMEMPISMKGSMKMDMEKELGEVGFSVRMSLAGEEENLDVLMYLDSDHVYATYDGENWECEALDDDSFDDGMDDMDDDVMELFSDDFLEDMAVREGTEDIDGRECVALDLVIDPDDMDDLSALDDVGDTLYSLGQDMQIGEATISLYADSETYLPVQLTFAIPVTADLAEDSIGVMSCDINGTIGFVSFDAVEIEIPAEALASAFSSNGGDDDVFEDDGDDDVFDDEDGADEDIPIAEGETVTVGPSGAEISFTAPDDMVDITYDKSLSDFKTYEVEDGELAISAKGYTTAADEYESDAAYYIDRGETEFAVTEDVEIAGGKAQGLYFKALDSYSDDGVSYTTLRTYMDVNGQCYVFDYTVFDNEEMDDMVELVGEVINSVG